MKHEILAAAHGSHLFYDRQGGHAPLPLDQLLYNLGIQ